MLTKIILLLFALSFLIKTDQSFNQDLGRHIKLGEIILQTHQVPKTNLFSYTNPNFPFINTHWLFEVFVYLGNQLLGVQPLLILKVFITLISVWLTLKIIPKQNHVLLLPIGFIFLHVLRERTDLRPEIFSFLFTAVTYFILEMSLRSRTVWYRSGNLLFILPFIQLLWINTHIYFFVGLILQAIFLIYMGYKRVNMKLPVIIFILSVLVSFFFPNGAAGILYPLNYRENYGYTIVENQTMFLLESIQFRDANFLFVKLSLGITFLSFVVGFLRKSLKLSNILISLFGATLALLNVRSFPYLVFLSLPAVLQNFGPVKKNGLAFSLLLVTCALLLLESFFYLNGSYYKYKDDQNRAELRAVENGKNALNFVLSNNLPNPIFNNFDIGSYILFKAYPKIKVFVDGRPEAYPSQFFTGIYIPSQADYQNFKEIEKIYNFKTVIFSHSDQTPWAKTFLQAVAKDETWKLVYIDDFITVFVKEEVAIEKNLNVIDLSKLDPNSFDFKDNMTYLKIGSFLLLTQNYQSAAKFIEKGYQIFPDSPYANAILGQVTGEQKYLDKSKNFYFW